MILKRLIKSSVLMAILLATLVVPLYAQPNVIGGSVTFWINGNTYTRQQVEPLLDDQGRVLVPLRFVVEALGAEVEWSNAMGLLQVRTTENHLAILQGSQQVYINGQIDTIENPLYYRAQTNANYVPLRFISAYCGSTIAYQQDPVSKAIEIRIDSDAQPIEGLPIVARGNARTTISDTELIAMLSPQLPRIGADYTRMANQYGAPLRYDINTTGDSVAVYRLHGHYRYIGVKQNRVSGWSVFGDNWRVGPIMAGQSWEALTAIYPFLPTQQVARGKDVFTLKQSEDNVGKKLMIVQGDAILEYYFDTVSNQLVAMRCSAPDVVIATKAYGYACKYYGAKPTVSLPQLSVSEQAQRDASATAQIIDLTNLYRARRGLKPLQKLDFAEKIALSHSKDMSLNSFVGHDSPTAGSLKQRYNIHAKRIAFLSENIAFGSYEGLEAVHAWINSPGHRDNLLGASFTHIGVGTIHNYYTQNFIRFK